MFAGAQARLRRRRGVRYLDGALITAPALAAEGVLAYTVDASLFTGQLPMMLAGDSGNGQVYDSPILTQGDRIVVRGYTIGMVSDNGDTHTVQIIETRG